MEAHRGPHLSFQHWSEIFFSWQALGGLLKGGGMDLMNEQNARMWGVGTWECILREGNSIGKGLGKRTHDEAP